MANNLIGLLVGMCAALLALGFLDSINPPTKSYVRCGEHEWHDVHNVYIEGTKLVFHIDRRGYAIEMNGTCEWGEEQPKQ